jgi:hypothetical protein
VRPLRSVALRNRGLSATPTAPVLARGSHIRRGLSDQAAAFTVDDPMTERLRANRPTGVFDDYQGEVFERPLDERFLAHRPRTPTGGPCWMHLAEPKP